DGRANLRPGRFGQEAIAVPWQDPFGDPAAGAQGSVARSVVVHDIGVLALPRSRLSRQVKMAWRIRAAKVQQEFQVGEAIKIPSDPGVFLLYEWQVKVALLMPLEQVDDRPLFGRVDDPVDDP